MPMTERDGSVIGAVAVAVGLGMDMAMDMAVAEGDAAGWQILVKPAVQTRLRTRLMEVKNAFGSAPKQQ